MQNFQVHKAGPSPLGDTRYDPICTNRLLKELLPIIYVFFPESKGRELEDFDRMFM